MIKFIENFIILKYICKLLFYLSYCFGSPRGFFAPGANSRYLSLNVFLHKVPFRDFPHSLRAGGLLTAPGNLLPIGICCELKIAGAISAAKPVG
jgi:hypothetical protein